MTKDFPYRLCILNSKSKTTRQGLSLKALAYISQQYNTLYAL